MSDEKRKLDPPFGLDMPFEEALQRFAQTDPSELQSPQAKPKKRRKLTMLKPRIATLEPRVPTLKSKPR